MRRLVVVTDYGVVGVPERVWDRYRDAYFRKRAPKKSAREAQEALDRDVMAMQHYNWVMGKDGIRW